MKMSLTRYRGSVGERTLICLSLLTLQRMIGLKWIGPEERYTGERERERGREGEREGGQARITSLYILTLSFLSPSLSLSLSLACNVHAHTVLLIR